jgi:hypothetical protein
MSKLLVIIPTKNEKNNLLEIVTILDASLKEIDYQIIISSNSNSDLDANLLNLDIKVFKTPKLFLTAEEHIFWIIRQVTGEYIWFLGDDDIPIENGVKELAKIINNSDFDCFVFNGLRATAKKYTNIQMINSRNAYEGKIQYFYKHIGLLNGPASISLYIVKRDLLEEKYLNEIENINAPIYSHLTLFVRSFGHGNFAYYPINIINHGRSDKEEGKATTSNWLDYAAKSGNFYNFPWTLGFLRNIHYLINAKVIKKDFLKNLVETDPRNKKYLLILQIEDNIRQIFVSNQDNLRGITDNELDELEKYIFEIEGFSEEIRMILSSPDPRSYILSQYPHVSSKLGNLNHKRAVIKHRTFILFKQAPKDYFWKFVTKLWIYVPYPIKLVVKRLKFLLRNRP